MEFLQMKEENLVLRFNSLQIIFVILDIVLKYLVIKHSKSEDLPLLKQILELTLKFECSEQFSKYLVERLQFKVLREGEKKRVHLLVMYETMLHIMSLSIDFQIKAFVIEYFTLMKSEFLNSAVKMRSAELQVNPMEISHVQEEKGK